ncbi:MAG: AsmA family protein [Alphaproteobacteria bacterium]|nr:AsmA family protein [Alphaproteobacteria bacterium]
MRKSGIIVAAIILSLVLIAIIVPNFIKLNNYKPLITEQVKKATGYTLIIDGDIQLTILPSLGAKLKDVKLAKGQEGILVAKEVAASVSLGDLLAKKVNVESASLVSPQIRLVVGEDGEALYMPDKQAPKPEDAPEFKTTENNNVKPQNNFLLKSLKVSDGSLTYINRQQQTEQKIDAVNIDVSAGGFTGPADIKGSLVYNGEKLELDAGAGKLDDKDKTMPVRGQLKYGALVNGKFEGTAMLEPALKFTGKIDAQTDKLGNVVKIENAGSGIQTLMNEKITLKGDIAYGENAASFKSAELGIGKNRYAGDGSFAFGDQKKLVLNLDPVGNDTAQSGEQKNLQTLIRDLSVDIQAEGTEGKMALQKGDVRLAGYDLKLSGGYDSVSQRPVSVLTVNVSTPKINLDELKQYGLLPEEGTKGEEIKVEGAGKKGKAATTGKTKLVFQADIGEMIYGGASYSNIKAAGSLQGQALSLSHAQVTALNGATVSASGRLDNMAALKGIDMAVKATTPDAEATLKTLNIAKPEAIKRPLGAVNADVKVQGDIDSLATSAVINALQFTLGAQGTVKNPTTKFEAENLSFSVKHPNMQQAIQTFQPQTTLPEGLAGPLNLKGRVDLEGKKYTVSDLSGTLGSASVAGNVVADLGGAKPDVKAQLQLGRFVVAANDNEWKTFGKGFIAPAKQNNLTYVATGAGKWSREALNLDWLNAFNLDLQMNIQELHYQLWRMNNVVLATTVNNGTLTIKDLQGGLFGGKMAISGTVAQASKGANVTLDNKIKIENVEARDLFSALTAKPQRFISGTIKDFNLDVKGQGVSQAAVVQSLNGTSDIKGENIIIYGVNVRALTKLVTGDGKPVEALGNFLGRTVSEGQSNFKTLSGDFPIQNGVVTVNDLTFDGDEAVMKTTGTVNLPAWLMDLDNRVSLKDEAEDAPSFNIVLKGPIDQPAKSVGQQALQSYLNKKLGSKLESFLGDKLGIKQPAAPAPTEAAPAADGTVAPAEQPEAQPASPKEQLKQEAIKGLFKALGN